LHFVLSLQAGQTTPGGNREGSKPTWAKVNDKGEAKKPQALKRGGRISPFLMFSNCCLFDVRFRKLRELFFGVTLDLLY
jgi:hypothetical protein